MGGGGYAEEGDQDGDHSCRAKHVGVRRVPPMVPQQVRRHLEQCVLLEVVWGEPGG